MGKLLSMIENPRPETVVEEEKLRYIISKTSIWDYFDISESTFKSYMVKEKSGLLNKYYSELNETYYGSDKFYFLFLFLFQPYGLVFCWFVACVWPCFL